MKRILNTKHFNYFHSEQDAFLIGFGNSGKIVIQTFDIKSYSKRFLKDKLVDNYLGYI